jgi:chromate transporter
MGYLTLIYEFLKVGLFSIGGGLATLPFLYQLADKHTWFTRETLMDMIAISESTPWPIGLNMATYAGYAAEGALGGVLASISLVVPSFFIVSFVVKILDKFRENDVVKAAFYGIRPAVAALITSAAIGIMGVSLLGVSNLAGFMKITPAGLYSFALKNLPLFLIILYLTRKYDKHPVYYIAGAALVGVLFSF